MSLVLVFSGLAMVSLPGLLRPLGRQLVPRVWAQLCIFALVAGAGIFELGLVLYAAPAVLSAVGIPGLALACERMVGGVSPGGANLGWIAAAVATISASLGALGLVKGRLVRQAARVEPWFGLHHSWNAYDLVILTSTEIVALSVKGNPSQVILSSGLIEEVGPEKLGAVLAHEKAHLDHSHQRYLAIAGVIHYGLSYFPLVRSSVAALHVALERWADETAADSLPNGRETLRDALFSVTSSIVGLSLPAFSAAVTVAERLQALERPPPQLRLRQLSLLFSPGFALSLASAASLGAWISNMHMLLEMAGRCPI